MRLWSLHPAYLDAKGLVALWREGLLAKAVLDGKTKGYKNHPQLERFKSHSNPKAAINAYLWDVVDEADKRGYNFNRTKLDTRPACAKIPVSNGQLTYEFEHLQTKLKARAPERHRQNQNKGKEILPHPLVVITVGEIANWERKQAEW
ncbi:MAG: pyrimidine dimer DNA glycosylase/endonuclease V [Anaerolineales bacterium]